MNVKYKMILEIEINHVFDGVEGLKNDREMAESVCEMVADEVATAGGVCSYDIKRSIIEIDSEPRHVLNEKFLMNRFMKVE